MTYKWQHVTPLADTDVATFDVWNKAYSQAYYTFGTCVTCNGVGGHSSQELQGDPPMTGWVSFFEACPDCIGAEKCPGCMQPLSLSFDQSAFEPSIVWKGSDYYPKQYAIFTFSYEDALAAMPFIGFTCLVCGWQFDPQREVDADNDYYEDEALMSYDDCDEDIY